MDEYQVADLAVSNVLTLENIATGLGFFVGALLVGLGFYNGKRSPAEPVQAPSAKMEIAGALIDGRDARALTDAIEENTRMLKDNSAAGRDVAEAAEAVARSLNRASDETRRLYEEMIRGARG